MLLESDTRTLMICSLLVILGLMITIDIAVYVRNHPHLHDKEREMFLDSDGDHVYYERSLIRMKKYFFKHPYLPRDSFRNISGLLKKFIKFKKSS